MRRSATFAAWLVVALTPVAAKAIVPIPGGHAGEVDVFFRLSLERGTVEPR